MKLFPHTMIRISGGPFGKMEALRLSRVPQISADIFKEQQKLVPIKQEISDGLYEFIPKVTDARLQKFLLNSRRDIFSGRNISEEKFNRMAPHLPEDLLEKVKQYRQVKETLRQLEEKGNELYPEDLAASRKRFQALVREDEKLQQGLLLGSQSLYNRIPSYLKRESRLKKKHFQVERGLTKYISRMYGKTSPFSTFTNLMMSDLSSFADSASGEKKFKPFMRIKDHQDPQVVYHIRINNYLYNYLKVLFTRNPNIYRHLYIRPNPTLQNNEDHYLFLTNSNNIEAFQRIPANPALEVFRILSSQKKEGIVYNDMVAEIIKNEYIDAPVEDLEAFINQLLEYGFMEFDFGVSGIDPDWDKGLRQKLQPVAAKVPLVKELLQVLESIRLLAEEYGRSDCTERIRLLEEAHRQFRDVCMKLHEDAGLPEEERLTPEERKKRQEEMQKEAGETEKEAQKEAEKETKKEDAEEDTEESEEEAPFKQFGSTLFNFTPEKMFYEDTSKDVTPSLEKGEMEAFTGCLHDLLQQMRFFEGHFDEREKMLFYFINKYGKDSEVDLMTFYEEYYRDFKKPEAMRQQGKTGDNIPEVPTIPALEEKTKKARDWTAAMTEQLAKNNARGVDEITVSLEDVKAVNRAVFGSSDTADTDCSYGCFVQFFVDSQPGKGENLKAMLNGSFGGFGKMLSRFLHIFRDDVTGDLRDWNSSLARDNQMLLENQDASFFNANLHPPLLPYEIHMPNGQNSLPPEQQVEVTDLKVKVDDSGKLLQLVHGPSSRQVHVFDLGFQGYRGRSQLFNLLEKFSSAEYLFANPINRAAANINAPTPEEAKEDTQPRIMIDPRVVYEDSIIMQRKAWSVPLELLPQRSPEDSDWDWFNKVNHWRMEQGLPEEVFIFVVDRAPAAPKKEEKKEENKEEKIQVDNKENNQEKIEEKVEEKTEEKKDDKKVEKRRTTPDDYKPQYINFNDPFLLNLLEKALKRVPERMRIVEMLPYSSQLLTLGSERHITEFVVHWYTYEEKNNREQE